MELDEAWISNAEKCADVTSHPSNIIATSVSTMKTTLRKSARLAKHMSKVEGPVPSDILAQICLAGSNPSEGYPFLPGLYNYLSDYRDQICQDNAGSKSGKRKGHVGSKRGKRKRADAQQHAESKRGKRKLADDIQKIVKRSSQDYFLQQEDSGEKSENKAGEMSTEECTETSLTMLFPESDAVPSVAQLINVFSRYGPLVQELSEVRKTEKHARVVFRIRKDAETAYTSAGKSNLFGKQVLYCLSPHS